MFAGLSQQLIVGTVVSSLAGDAEHVAAQGAPEFVAQHGFDFELLGLGVLCRCLVVSRTLFAAGTTLGAHSAVFPFFEDLSFSHVGNQGLGRR